MMKKYLKLLNIQKMFKIVGNDFNILNKYKIFIIELDNLIENIPRKDYFYKDKIRKVSNYILELILKCNYETDNSNINYYVTNIKGSIAYLDFLLDRLYDMKYINEKNLYKITLKLIEINKMISGWLNNKDESTFK